MNGFAVTGDEFFSSYNTFGADENHRFHLRRLFVLHQSEYGKTELGAIPTYKGRVSSTGLSKDGWITGMRYVRNISSKTQLEGVIGELAHTQNPNVFQSFDKIDYFELELSTQLSPTLGYELGLERMLEQNFLRGELRYQLSGKQIIALELINRVDNNHFKTVLSMEGQWQVYDYETDYFLYYSYVDAEFGDRAELTEDFVDFGHALTFELEGELLPKRHLDWFSKVEFNEGQKRFQLGMKFKI